MAGRIRTLKPEWLENERLAGCSSDARVLSIGLILLADDHGNGRGSLGYLAGQIWQTDPDLARVSRASRELLAIGFVKFYRANDQTFFSIPGWQRHQVVDRPSKPRVPVPEEGQACDVPEPTREGLANAREGLARPSRLTPISDLRSPTPISDLEGDPGEPSASSVPTVASSDDPAVSPFRLTPPAAEAALVPRVNGHAKKSGSPSPAERAVAQRVLSKLNERTGRSFTSDAHVIRVVRLLRKGFTEDDLRTVVWDRCNRWLQDDRMTEYLRPATLFGPEKFPDYLAEGNAAWHEHEQRRAGVPKSNQRIERHEPVSPLVASMLRTEPPK